MNRSAALFAPVILCAAVLGGCSKNGAQNGPPPAPHVDVALPLSRDVVDWDEYVGRFEAPQTVNLTARITGVVTQILFRNGQDVKAGQPLFVIDPRPYRATLEQAEAQIASARATLTNARSVAARSADLVKAQAVSKEELENDQAQVRTAQAALQGAIANADNARLNLSFTTVHSPVSGRVSDRRVSLGDQVTAGTTLLTTVVSLDPIWFSFDGAESFYLKYQREAQKGQRDSSRSAPNPVDIQLSDETSYRWHGRMQFVDNALDPQTGTIRAHAVVANPNHFLTPGMFGRARLLGSGTYKALLVPDEVIVADQSRKLVFVLGADNKVAQRPVETGPEVEGLRAIRDGLAPTDLVLLDGISQLQPGAQVVPNRTQIKPRAPDTSPQIPIVIVPQASTATSPGPN
jgi:RND family efflux transporter MFP subunit